MKKICFVAVSAAAVMFCGCRHTHVEQVRAGEGRQDWYRDIKSNYPGFRPPRLVSPGISGLTGPKAASAPATFQDTSSLNEVEALPVDPAGDTPVAPVEVKPEVKADDKAEAKTEAKADDKAEVKAEVKAEAKADDKAAGADKTAGGNDKKKIEPPDPTSSEIYVVQYGDTLGALSKKFYGSVRYVNLLQKANSDIITNANVLKPGMKLIIPKL